MRLPALILLLCASCLAFDADNTPETGFTDGAVMIVNFDASGYIDLVSRASVSPSGTVSIAQSAGGSPYASITNNATTTNFVNVANSTNFAFGTSIPFTWTAWVKIIDNTANSRLVDKRPASGGPGFEVFFLTATKKIRSQVANSSGGFCNIDNTIDISADGAWHFIAVVFNRNPSCTTNDIVVYVDGTRDTTAVATATANCNADVNNGNAIQLGTATTYVQSQRGPLDDERLYPRALTQTEIQWMYQDQRSTR